MRPWALPCALVALAFASAGPARAQLLSPGPLAEVHAELEGVRNCTQCHELGRRGVDPGRCLSCHTPLRDRIRAGRGLHARVERNCASCHSDHHGRDFDTARFDEQRFDHRRTGFELVGDHRGVACQSCHTPRLVTDRAVRRQKQAAGRLDATFLGVATDCATCHRNENPHRGALRTRNCASCHSAEGWDRVPRFDHAQTGVRLTGAHARAACIGCHGPPGGGATRFREVPTACASCHAEASPHGRQFAGQPCSACHATTTWTEAPAFSHARTSFPLVGRHVGVACVGCHPTRGGRQQFVGIDAGTCQSCHDDAHDGALGADCATCHTPSGWSVLRSGDDGADALAERFDHETHTGFALVGAHAEASCTACHGDGRAPAGFTRRDADFHIRLAGSANGATFPAIQTDGGACLACHTDAHDGQMADLPDGADCASCHGQDAWTPGLFDRARHEQEAGFALVGAHAVVPCSACHTRDGDAPPAFDVPSACAACHADASPHGDQFAGPDGVTACADCHVTDSWDVAAFDHAERTGFALTGAHHAATCTSCHARPDDLDAPWSFAGLSTTCASCHAEDDPHAGQFEGRLCSSCHDTEAFALRSFDHTRTAFPLEGAHATVACAACHRSETSPDGTSFVRFTPLPTACAGCHTDR